MVSVIEDTGANPNVPPVNLPTSVSEPSKPAGLMVTVRPSDALTPPQDKIQKALDAGYSMEEIQAHIKSKTAQEPTKTAPVTPSAPAIDIPSLQQSVSQAQEHNLKKEDIVSAMKAKGYDEATISSAMTNAKPDWKRWTNFDPKTSQEDARDIADLYRNIHEERDTLLETGMDMLSSERSEVKRNQVLQLNKSLVEALRAKDINAYINPDTHNLMMMDENGMEQELNSGILNSLYNSKMEVTGGIVGGTLGGMAAANAATAYIPPVTPVTALIKGAAVLAGGVAGAATGVMAGRAADMTVSAMKLKEELEGELVKKQVIDAGLSDVVDTLTLGGVGYLGAKTVVKAYDMFLGGHAREALKYIKETYLLSDEQVDKIHKDFMKAQDREIRVDTSLPRKVMTLGMSKTRSATKTEQKIAAVLHTQRGRTTEVLSEAAARDGTVATVIENNINNRAKALQGFVQSATDKNIGNQVRKDLAYYKADVEHFYGTVKKGATDVIDETDFTFSPSEIALPPFIQRLRTEFVNNPDGLSPLASHILKIEDALDKPNFSNLIELRQTMNEIYYTKNLDFSERKAIREAQNRIDATIDKAAKEYLSNGKQWVDDFKKAKKEYSKMKRLEENVVYKNIVNEDKKEGNIQATLNSWGNLEDVDVKVFNAVADRLSPKTRAKVEAAAISNFTNKVTKGQPTDLQAVNFVELDRLVSNLNITTSEGKFLKKVIKDYAIYTNDYGQAGITGRIEGVGGNVISPATTAAGKLEATFFGYTFNFIRNHLAMTKAGRGQALVQNAIKLLQNPLHAKTADDLIKAMPNESRATMQSLVKQIREQYTLKPPKNNPNIKAVPVSEDVTSGRLGNGLYLKDKGSKTVNVDVTKLAGPMDINKAMGRIVSEKEIRTNPTIQRTLERLGFVGIQDGKGAKLFSKTINTNQVIRDKEGAVTSTITTEKVIKGSKERTNTTVLDGEGELVKTIETNKKTKGN